MKEIKKLGLGMIALVLLAGLVCMPQQALAVTKGEAAAAAFYKGKTVELVVPYNPGGGLDTMARNFAPLLTKYLGATIIVKNEPGAGGKVSLNRLARENNGLSMITIDISAAAMAQVFGDPGAKYDVTKFNWLGRIALSQDLIVTGKKSGYKSISDLQKAKEVRVGADTPGSGTALRPLVAGHLFGITINLITGYKGSPDVMMALLRGEIDISSPSIPLLMPYVKTGDAIPLIAIARQRFKLLPDVPTIYEIKKLSEAEKKIADICTAHNVGRVYATTPGVPPERVAFLESALKKATEDPVFIKRAEASGELLGYASGKQTSGFINTMIITGEEKKLFGKFLAIEGY